MIIDVNVHLSRWPTRRLPYDEPTRLVEKLRTAGIQQAWAGSFDAMLHRDIAAVNVRTASECKNSGPGILLPVGSINITLPDWKDDIRRCVEEHGMRILRVYPNYHGYDLNDPRFAELLGECSQRKLVLQIAVSMEDDRTQHPLMRVAPVDVRPLKSLLENHTDCAVLLMNAMRSVRVDDLPGLTAAGKLYIDISNLEGAAGIEKMLQHVSHERILLGSHFPFFNVEAALLKLRESELAGVQIEAITHQNAQRLLETVQ